MQGLLNTCNRRRPVGSLWNGLIDGPKRLSKMGLRFLTFRNHFVGYKSMEIWMSNAQSRMKILGIEWSSNKRTIAFGDWSEGEHVRILATAELSGGRDSKYFRAFTDAAEQAGVMKNEIETVVVGLGPGSYAGIRSAISAAYGWHLANDAKLIGIPSDRVLARKTFNDNSINRVHTLVDAQRGECYHALYEKRENGSIEVVQSLSIVNPNELLNLGSVNDVFVGYDIQRWFKGGIWNGLSARRLSGCSFITA